MRLDKFISNNSKYSRREVKKLINKKWIKVNEIKISDASMQINKKDKVSIKDKKIFFFDKVYYVLDKPKGYISSTKDKINKTVMELIPEKYKNLNLKPVGRLDKDTTGLLILTNDNDFIHKMTNPKNKIPKKYIVTLVDDIKSEYKNKIENGIKLKNGLITKKSIYKQIDKNICELTIIEGKYHQIKRMFGALGNKVIELRRISFGNYKINK